MVHKVSERKRIYKQKLLQYCREYKKVLLIGVDNVGSNQLHQVRQALRGKAVVLMGKNTMIRNILREYVHEDAKISKLIPQVRGNMGFVFTKENIKDIRNIILSNQIPAQARPGALAPQSVDVPAGPTNLDPGQTSFFQALNIPTKIVRGQIEITNVVHLLKVGDKVGNSEAALLNKLNIRPFHYGCSVVCVYDDGAVISPEAMDLTEEDMIKKFLQGIRIIAALGTQIGYPTLASIPFSISKAFSKLVSLAVMTEYEFEESKKYREFIENPDAFAVAAAPAEEEKGDAGGQAAAEESSSSSSEEAGGGMGGLFGDSDS